jgi:hypothetical protein
VLILAVVPAVSPIPAGEEACPPLVKKQPADECDSVCLPSFLSRPPGHFEVIVQQLRQPLNFTIGNSLPRERI